MVERFYTAREEGEKIGFTVRPGIGKGGIMTERKICTLEESSYLCFEAASILCSRIIDSQG